MKKHIIPTLLIFGSLFTACKKDHDHADEAEITIFSPSAGQTFNLGDTVFIKAKIEAESALHGWKVEIKKQSDQSVIFSADKHSHAATYNIDEYWVNGLTEHTNLDVVVTADIDHGGKTVSKSVSIHCHP